MLEINKHIPPKHLKNLIVYKSFWFFFYLVMRFDWSRRSRWYKILSGGWFTGGWNGWLGGKWATPSALPMATGRCSTSTCRFFQRRFVNRLMAMAIAQWLLFARRRLHDAQGLLDSSGKNKKNGSENLHIDAEANKMLFNLQARSDASVNVLPSFPMWCAEGYGPNQYIASSIKNGYTWTVTKINQTCCLATCSL